LCAALKSCGGWIWPKNATHKAEGVWSWLGVGQLRCVLVSAGGTKGTAEFIERAPPPCFSVARVLVADRADRRAERQPRRCGCA
jgi:hypothetical protein